MRKKRAWSRPDGPFWCFGETILCCVVCVYVCVCVWSVGCLMHWCSLDASSSQSCETKPSLDAAKLDGKIAPVENHSFKAYGPCIRILQRTESIAYVCIYLYICLYQYLFIYLTIYIYKAIYFKELAHLILEAGKSKVCRMSWQAGDSGKLMFQFEFQDCLLWNQGERCYGWSLRGVSWRIVLLLFCADLQMIRWGLPNSEKHITLFKIHQFKC